jgi:uncharacterized protein (DUF2147 family)
MKKLRLCSLLLMLVAKSGFSANLEGLWLTENKDAKVRVYLCDDKICGDLVWLKEPNWTKEDVLDDKLLVLGEPKLDTRNDDKSLRSRPLVGIKMLTGLKSSDDNEWDGGKIYDAESGNTYSCQAKLSKDGNTLKMKGYIGVSWLGRTTTWTRAVH